MKKLMFKINLLKLLVGLSLILISQNSFAICNKVGTVFTSAQQECQDQPLVQNVKFYKAALCSSRPGAPTLATPIDLSSCKTIWSNPAGEILNVQKGVATGFTSGTFAEQSTLVGTYTFFYMELDPTFTYKWAGRFNAAMTPDGVGARGGSAFCFTNGVSARTWNNGAGSRPGLTCTALDLAAATASAVLTDVSFNAFSEDATDTIIIDDVPTPSGKVFSAAILNPTNTMSLAVQNTAPIAGSRIGAWGAQNVQVKVDSDFELQFSNTEGITLQLVNANGVILGISGGAFDFALTAK